MTIKFDRSAPGSGVEVLCRLERGRAYLEWRFHFTAYSENRHDKITIPPESEKDIPDPEWPEESVRLRLTDGQDNPVLECVQFLREEEPLRSILHHPRVWEGISAPHLYNMEAVLADGEGNCLDRITRQVPLRQVETRTAGEGKEEIFLNGEVFQRRMVRYALPEAGNPAQRQGLILEDLGLLRNLGADCILLDAPDNVFLGLCDRMGFLVFTEAGCGAAGCPEDVPESGLRWKSAGDRIPVFRGLWNSFFLPGRKSPAPLFYRYKAEWSREPFVYLVPESLKRQDDGNYTVCCYSNCSRVALYSDGRLFEFRTGETEFLFSGIPCGKPAVMLTAEAQGCSHSLSIHKSFTKQSRNHDIFPLE